MAEPRSLRLYLTDIIDSISQIERYVKGISEIDFLENLEKQDAIIRRIEIIGEAVKHVPSEIRQKYPDIPWRKIAGLRDVAIHHYFGVSPELIWQIATIDTLVFKHKIEKVLKDTII